ncbi:MAG: N-acetyltransferase [Deltaproteobacteria bacterium]|nr:MAG: N-acetyltransferase [Deltaproteobacteria bacterium]
MIRGEGLCLRPLDLDGDLPAMHAIFGDPDSATYLARAATKDASETRALLEGWSTAPQWAITEEGGEAMGRITLVPVRQAVAEIGVMVVPAFRGRGLARRAVRVLTAHALATGHIRVQADIDPANTPSVRTFEAAGYVFEGHLRNTWLTHTGPADTLMYAAIATP